MPGWNGWIAIGAATALGLIAGASTVALVCPLQPDGWAEVLAIGAFTAVGLIVTGTITFAAAEKSAAPIRDQVLIGSIGETKSLHQNISRAISEISNRTQTLHSFYIDPQNSEDVITILNSSKHKILIECSINDIMSEFFSFEIEEEQTISENHDNYLIMISDFMIEKYQIERKEFEHFNKLILDMIN